MVTFYLYELYNQQDQRVDTFIKLKERLKDGWKLAKNSYIKVFNENKKPIYVLYSQDDVEQFIADEELIESRKREAQWETNTIGDKQEWKPFEELEELSEKKMTFAQICENLLKQQKSEEAKFTAPEIELEIGDTVMINGVAHKVKIKDGKNTFGFGTTSIKGVAEPSKDAINPSHYQAFFGGIETMEALQWLEAKQYEGQFKDPVRFKAAVSLQIEKYLDRNGGKDDELQELSKGLWYNKFLVAYIKNGNKPIRVKDIPKLLEGI